jgi:hypothetical protein
MKCCMFCRNFAKIGLKRCYFLQDLKWSNRYANHFINGKLIHKGPNGNPD